MLAQGLQKALDGPAAEMPIPWVMRYQLEDGWTSVHFVRPAHGHLQWRCTAPAWCPWRCWPRRAGWHPGSLASRRPARGAARCADSCRAAAARRAP